MPFNTKNTTVSESAVLQWPERAFKYKLDHIVHPLFKTPQPLWNMEVLQKDKNRITTGSSHSWAYIQRNLWFKKIHALLLTAALFTIAKIWRQPNRPTTDEWVKKMMWCMYIMESSSAVRKEWNNAISIKMNTSRDHPKRSESDRETQTPMTSLTRGIYNMTQMNLALNKETRGHREQTVVASGEGRGEMEWKAGLRRWKPWHTGFPRWLRGKEPACQHRRLEFDPWVREMPWRRKWQPTPVFLPGKSHGQRSLVGHSPWGHKRVGQGHNLATKQQQQHRMDRQ